MRFIVHEQAYEKPIASGQLRYERDGRATGAVETWRLSQATAGYEVLRVDLDAREAESGQSTLFHLVRQDNGIPERLSYRFWSGELNVQGTFLFAETSITGTRTLKGRTTIEDVDLPPDYGFWFPSTIGLGLLVGFGSGTAVTLASVNGEQLKVNSDRFSVFGLQVVEVDVVPGKTQALAIRWQDQERTIWLDEHNWPVKMRRGDGLTAVENRPIHYK